MKTALLEAALEVLMEMGAARRVPPDDRLSVREPLEADSSRDEALAQARSTVHIACQVANHVQNRELSEDAAQKLLCLYYPELNSRLLQRVLAYAFYVTK